MSYLKLTTVDTRFEKQLTRRASTQNAYPPLYITFIRFVAELRNAIGSIQNYSVISTISFRIATCDADTALSTT